MLHRIAQAHFSKGKPQGGVNLLGAARVISGVRGWADEKDNLTAGWLRLKLHRQAGRVTGDDLLEFFGNFAGHHNIAWAQYGGHIGQGFGQTFGAFEKH